MFSRIASRTALISRLPAHHLVLLGLMWAAAVPLAQATAPKPSAKPAERPNLQAACRNETGARRTALLELYTSEGCDSCPPADAWLATLKPTDAAIPLAWHVDYWDRLGWKDRFARADATARQRAQVQAQGDRVVYTPQLLASSKTVRWADDSRVAARIKEVNAQPSPVWMAIGRGMAINGYVGVELVVQATDKAGAATHAGTNGAQAWVALVEDGLESKPNAGENRGAVLKHDHVVREVIGPLKVTRERMAHVHALSIPADADVDRIRMVGWVEAANGEVLGAVATRCVNQ
jgi:hypothetical protein